VAKRKIGGSTWIDYLFTNRADIVTRLLSGPTSRLLVPRKLADRVAADPGSHVHFILQLLCLHLFNKLIIDDKYDADFEQPSMPATLDEFV